MRFTQPTEEQERSFAAWVAERPEVVRALIGRMKFDPWTLYRLKSTGHRVGVTSFGEVCDPKPGKPPVTLTLCVSGRFNLVAFERNVFGIDPDDLEECDLPAADEPVGSAGLSPEEVMRMSASLGGGAHLA